MWCLVTSMKTLCGCGRFPLTKGGQLMDTRIGLLVPGGVSRRQTANPSPEGAQWLSWRQQKSSFPPITAKAPPTPAKENTKIQKNSPPWGTYGTHDTNTCT
mmetsp:Transcript_1783/g.3502  ORF Transcript_1783/g.3502 Transcript_1783/m.3502 type:complete len:101 (-) Transcript_1783:113-415(-)